MALIRLIYCCRAYDNCWTAILRSAWRVIQAELKGGDDTDMYECAYLVEQHTADLL